MAPPSKSRVLEEKYGDLHKVIPKLVNELGQKGAADALGTSQSFISMWLSANHYEQFIEYRQTPVQSSEAQP